MIVSGGETASESPRARRITPWGRIARYALAGSAGSAASAFRVEGDPDEGACAAAYLADERMVGKRRECLEQLVLELAAPLDQPLPLEDVDVRERGGARGWRGRCRSGRGGR